MEVAITKMSENGQIVIPSEIRRDAGIKPSTKFLIFNSEGNIMLKQLNENFLSEDIELLNKIFKSEEQIKKGKFTKVDKNTNINEIYDLLMK